MLAKKAIITGSNQGIGYAIIDQLLKGDTFGKIIMTSRDKSRGEKAIEKLIRDNGQEAKNRLELMSLDLMDIDSVRKLASDLQDRHSGVDCIFQNAGIFEKENNSDEAFYTQWNTNFINTTLLSEEILKNSSLNPKGKMIYLSSQLGKLSKIKTLKPDFYLRLKDFKNLSRLDIFEAAEDYESEYLGDKEYRNDWPDVYNQTKMFLTLYVYNLAQRKEILDSGIQVYSLCPGYCHTNMTNPDHQKGATIPLTAKDGAEKAVFLATDLPFELDMKYQGQHFVNNEISKIA